VQELFGGAGGLGWVVVKAVLLFAVALIGLRVAERRTLAQFSAFDFAVAVAIGATIGRTVTAASTSFATGAVALVTFLVMHRIVAFARQHSRVARAIDHPPRILIADGRIRHRELAWAGLTSPDVYMLLREHGVGDLSQVGYLLYEPRGRTTLIRAGEELGPVMQHGLAAAGYLNEAGPDGALADDDREPEPAVGRTAQQGLTAGDAVRGDDRPASSECGEGRAHRAATTAGHAAAWGRGKQCDGAVLAHDGRRGAAEYGPVGA
jgi:uncharacterized membrane protein YcaP (DUF421 family)